MTFKSIRRIFYSLSESGLYRQLVMDSPERQAGKSDFETCLLNKLIELKADVVLLDGLLVILDELLQLGSDFCRKVVNIHPRITNIDSPYERVVAHTVH